jgi:hypothetical protein
VATHQAAFIKERLLQVGGDADNHFTTWHVTLMACYAHMLCCALLLSAMWYVVSCSNTYSALNALAGHYNSFGATAPIPKKRLDRLTKVSSDVIASIDTLLLFI